MLSDTVSSKRKFSVMATTVLCEYNIENKDVAKERQSIDCKKGTEIATNLISSPGE
jgi:hypothetical protein